MSCISHLNLCPASGDTENVLLQKILQSVNAGGGVAGVSSISVNGGLPQTGAVSISTGGTVTSVNGDPGPAVLLDTSEIPELTNLYFTVTRVRATDLTGLVATAGVVSATDTILQAFGKVAGTTNNLLNFRDSGVGGHTDASIFINSGATEIVTVQGADSFIRLASERLQRNVTTGKIALLGGTAKGTGAYIELHGDTSAGSIGLVQIITKGQATSEGLFRIFNAAIGSAAADIRAEMQWEGNWVYTPTWNAGGTTFTGLKLNLTDTASAAASLLLDLQVSATSRFNVAKTGALRIAGSSAATSLLYASTDTTATGLTIFEQASADTDSYDLSFRKTRGTVAVPTAITSGDTLGNIMFRGYSGAAGYVTAASIRAVSSGTIATTRVASSLIFATGTDAAPTVLTDQMWITNQGRVGIGQSAPTAPLEILTAGGLNRAIVIDTVAADNYEGIQFRRQGSDCAYLGQEGTSGAGRIYIGAVDGVNFQTSSGTMVLGTNRLVIFTGGVGVGPGQTPSANLDINNSTTPTKLYVYETTDGAASPSNYSRSIVQTQAGNHLIRTEAAGTGTLRILQVGTGPKVGTDIAGANAIFHSGQPTGNAAPGAILFQQGLPAGGTGAGVTALATIWSIDTAGNLTATEARNIIVGTTTGTKIATATAQKVGFWNATPIVQPTTAVAAATFVTNTSGIINDSATFDGYTIGQVVKALRNAGLLA